MSTESTVSGAPAGRKRRRSALWPIIGVIAALVIVVVVCAQLWTEVLWYRQVGYSKVLVTRWATQGVLFVIFGGLAAVAIWVSMRVAYRSRPIYPPTSQESMNLDRYRQAIEPLRRGIEVVLPVLVGLFSGTAAAGQWSTFQLLLHQQPFGTADPQFGFDIGFYVFVLPALRFIVGFGTSIALICGIVAIITHYLYGGLSFTPGTQRVTKAARVQICVTGATFMVFLGAGFWLDQYSMLSAATGKKFDGAGYTAVHAVLPAKEIMAAAAVLVGAMFLVAAFRGTWRLPVVGIAVMLVCAIAVSWIFPAAIERFKVQPNAQRLESSYIQRNIDATQAAYGLQDVEVQQYDAETKATPGALRQDAVTTASIRLLDPMIVSPAFRQLQQYRGFYSFPDTLAVDRYDIDGQLRDTVIAAREVDLSGLTDQQRTWVNEATVYTHGYGVVAAYGNTVDQSRKPEFFQEGIPTTGKLGDYEPRIYFSPKSPRYSIVGAPEGTKPWELDYPDVKQGDQQKYTTFTGNGGPDIGSLWNKLLYAIKFGSEQILFSSSVTSESQILYDRSPTTRVEKVAPYLTLDGRTYPAVVDGHIVWIVDGYTTAATYPYAAVSSLQLATEDSVTARSQSVEALAPAMVNYIRNSVKATVDAYDGTVTLYAWDPDDPILKAWMSVFPATVKPMSEISGTLMSHLRYPEDLFKVQRQLLARYHVTDPETFYTGGDFWRVPDDPTMQNQSRQQPPYYLTLQMPSQKAPTFSLTSTFIPASTDSKNARNNLTGYLAVDAEPGNTTGKKAADYGKFRLLQLAGDVPVAGPGQEQSAFASTQQITEQLSLVTTGQKAEVLYGNLLTLPVGGGLLYVQPIYVQGTTGTGNYPFMNMVLVGFGENVAFAPTLDVALDQIFGGDSGASAGDAGVTTDSGAGAGAVEGAVDTTGSSGSDSESPPEAIPAPTPTATPTATATAPSTPNGDAQSRLNAALQDANQAMQDSQTALANGDWTAYGDAQDRLKAAIDAALQAQAELSGNAGG